MVVPHNAADLLKSFTDSYKSQLSRLGIMYAPEDPERKKAFDASTSGECLGVWFDTVSMTWNLPDRKIVLFVNDILGASVDGALISVNEVEVIFGKLNHFSQICPPIKLLIGEVLQFLQKNMVEVVRCEKFRYDKSLSMPAPMKHDLRTCAAIVWDTR